MANSKIMVEVSPAVVSLLARRQKHYEQPIDRFSQSQNHIWVAEADFLNIAVAEVLTALLLKGVVLDGREGVKLS